MALGARRLAAALGAAIFSLTAGAGLAQDAGASAPAAPAARLQPAATPLPEPSRPAPPPPAPLAPQAPGAPAARLAPGQPIPPAELEAFVDGLAAQAMTRGHVAGAVVSVVQNGQVVLAKGYGLDRLSPARAVDPQRTLFRLGAISETFTWIALMREIEAGRMRLDGPVNLYLPQPDQIPDQGFDQPVRLRDLLTHTSGFEDRAYGQLMEESPKRIRPLETYLKQERPGRVREPGLAPSRSAYGAALAGEAVIQVTGKPMQDLAQSEVFGPLGMRGATLREPYPARADLPAPMDAALADNVSQGFRWTGDGFEVRPFEYMTQVAPARAASSTGVDMARYMLAILGDGTFGGASIYSPQIARDFRTPLWRAAPGASSWDYGFREFALPGGFRGYGQDGATLSFRSSLVTVPALGLGVFVAANTEAAEPFTSQAAAEIIQRFYTPPPSPPAGGSDWLAQNGQAFTGDYLTTARAYHGLERFVDLLGGLAKVRTTPEGLLLTSGPAGPERWTPDAGAALDAPHVLFHQIDGPGVLVFDMSQGQAVRWIPRSTNAAYERAPFWSHRWVLAVLAAAVATAACGSIAGLFLRDRRDFRQTSIQGRADAAQVSASILWLTALAGFWIWRWGTSNAAALMYGWPGAWLLIASACAFVATIMTVLCLVLLPVAWRGGRRLDSWTTGRKARFTVTTVLFCLLALTLGFWGALEPWSR
jgi:CubicO group peptidase (beta-lactamase class C family)